MASDRIHHHSGKSSESLLNKDVILLELNIQNGQTILDAGCGNGYMAKEFAKLLNGTGMVYALDPDEQAIEILQKEVQGNNIKPLVADITQTTPIESFSVDLLYMATVFHGLPRERIADFQKEVNRLLKPDAIMAIVEIKKESTPFGPPLKLRYSPAELRQVIPFIPKGTIDVGSYFYMQVFKNTQE